VLLVGETRCISDAQAAQLCRYVERGGVLVACRDVGTLLCVTLNARRRADGSLMIHLHNNPGSAYPYPSLTGFNYLHTPGEVLEIRDLVIHLHGMAAKSAHSGLSGERQEIGEDGRTITLSRLALHEVILVETASWAAVTTSPPKWRGSAR